MISKYVGIVIDKGIENRHNESYHMLLKKWDKEVEVYKYQDKCRVYDDELNKGTI